MTIEEKALKEYPPKMKAIYGPFEGANEPSIVDDNLKYRIGYIKGYEQAIEDLKAKDSMVTEDYVSFEIAKLLKEKGLIRMCVIIIKR